LPRFKFEYGTFRLFYLYSYFVGESRCLSRVVQEAGATWHATMRIVTGVGDLVLRTRNGRTDRVLGDRMIERSGDAVCDLHCAREDEKRVFLD
jgi:hypothetical protein